LILGRQVFGKIDEFTDRLSVFLRCTIPATVDQQELCLIFDLIFVLIDLPKLRLHPVEFSPQLGGLLTELLRSRLYLLSNLRLPLDVLLQLLLNPCQVLFKICFFRFNLFLPHSEIYLKGLILEYAVFNLDDICFGFFLGRELFCHLLLEIIYLKVHELEDGVADLLDGLSRVVRHIYRVGINPSHFGPHGGYLISQGLIHSRTASLLRQAIFELSIPLGLECEILFGSIQKNLELISLGFQLLMRLLDVSLISLELEGDPLDLLGEFLGV